MRHSHGFGAFILCHLAESKCVRTLITKHITTLLPVRQRNFTKIVFVVPDKKFPGNPTQSYRTLSPLKIVGVIGWNGHTPETLQNMRENIEKLRNMGIGAIE